MIAWLALPAALATTVPPLPEGARGWQRPVLSGPTQTLDSDDGFFRVHWTDEGVDRPAGDDADADGIPDAVTRTLDTLVQARDVFQERGYRSLIEDDGAGGSPALDLYLTALDINGYAYGLPVEGESDRGACFMEVDGRLAGSGTLLESVVAHELHHCVQYRYTWEADSWLHEATSTYEQYRAVSDPALELALGLLWSTRLDGADLPIDSLSGRFEYAGFVFLKFWEEFGGGDGERGHRLWEALSARPDWRATLDGQSEVEWGQSFDQTFLDHATWNGFACARDDGQHYGDEHLPCQADIAVPVAAVEGAAFEVVHGHAPYTAAYVELPAAGDPRPFAVSCDGPGPGAEAGLRLVALAGEGTGGEQSAALAEGDGGLEVALTGALDPSGAVLAVFTSAGAEPATHACTAERRELPPPPEEEPAGGCATGGAASSAWIGALALVFGRRRRAPSGPR